MLFSGRAVRLNLAQFVAGRPTKGRGGIPSEAEGGSINRGCTVGRGGGTDRDRGKKTDQRFV